MNERTRKGFIYHTRTEDYKKHLKETIQIIEKIPEDYYVSYSGGKDSTVLTHLCLKANPSRIIWHWDYGDYLIPRPIEEEVMDNLYLLGARRVIYDKRVCEDARTNHGYGYKQFFKTIQRNMCIYNLDGGIIGVRREESKTRKNRYTSYFQEGNYYPLLNWTWEDVWGYICVNNLPYVSTYDYYSEIGGWDKSRFVTFFDGEFEQLSMDDGVIMPEYRGY